MWCTSRSAVGPVTDAWTADPDHHIMPGVIGSDSLDVQKCLYHISDLQTFNETIQLSVTCFAMK